MLLDLVVSYTATPRYVYQALATQLQLQCYCHALALCEQGQPSGSAVVREISAVSENMGTVFAMGVEFTALAHAQKQSGYV
jgi:hypothetical protein